MVDHIEGDEIPRHVEAMAIAMMSLADQAEDAGVRAVEVTARDAATALLALLDVLVGPNCETLNNPSY